MTAEEVAFLDRATDRVVALELTSGEQFFAEIVMVVDQPPTPDVFVLRCTTSTAGESILLADIARVAALPGLEYP